MAACTWWSAPGNIEILRLLWEVEAWPARAIAAELGTTRNAVIGKANRIGLTPRAMSHRGPVLTLMQRMDALEQMWGSQL
jgi:hypothetical protein